MSSWDDDGNRDKGGAGRGARIQPPFARLRPRRARDGLRCFIEQFLE
jgi:hypothetical protein